MSKLGVVLVGHGVPASDCPAELIGELMGLQWGAGGHHGGAAPRCFVSRSKTTGTTHLGAAAGASGSAATHLGAAAGSGRIAERIAQLDAKIRDWPRHAGNDPYKEGLERVAAALKPMLPSDLLVIGYNEFCRPSVSQALEQAIAQGAARVLVISAMITPGGLHSENDIPHSIDAVRKKHPAVSIEYLWPFDIKEVASLFAGQIQRVSDAKV